MDTTRQIEYCIDNQVNLSVYKLDKSKQFACLDALVTSKFNNQIIVSLNDIMNGINDIMNGINDIVNSINDIMNGINDIIIS